MIHHTILPDELVWDGLEKLENQVVREIKLAEITMLIEQISPNRGKILRMISPNPMDYTKPHFAPGSIIEFVPDIPAQ